MYKTIWIGVAGLVGTLLRYWLAGFVARHNGETFPLATLVVNVVGCFLAGAVFSVTEERLAIDPALRTIILIGLLGGFTTFSSYGLQTFTLLKDGAFALAASEGNGHVDVATDTAPEGSGHADVASYAPESNGHVDVASYAAPEGNCHAEVS